MTLAMIIGGGHARRLAGRGRGLRDWPRRKVQIGMGMALFGAAALMVLSLLGHRAGAGIALALTGAKLAHRRRHPRSSSAR